MAQMNAYLLFKNKAKEAMTFYQGVFGGKLDVMLLKDSPTAANIPPEMQEGVMHSYLESGKVVIMASDMMDQNEQPVHGNTVSLCLVCDSKEEIQTLFNKLSEGGEVEHALKEEFFGTYGDLKDKYGFRWMFQYSPKKEN